MQIESHARTLPATELVEPRFERLRRHGRRTGLYTWAFGLVALLVVLIALVVANTRQVRLSWVVGTGHASLVWIILASAVLGWLLGDVHERRLPPADAAAAGGIGRLGSPVADDSLGSSSGENGATALGESSLLYSQP